MMMSGRALRRVMPIFACLSVVGVATTCSKDSTTPQVPVALAKVSGDGQTAAAHQTLPQPLVVKVTDADGGGVPAVRVVWSTTYSGGSDLDTSATDRDGVARLQVTLDTLAGAYTVSASAATLAPVTFAITCTPGPAAKLIFLVQPSDAAALSPISPAVQVGVRDQWSNAVTTGTVSVQIWITGGTGTAGATLSGANIRSTAQGVVSFSDLSIDKVGTGYTLTALGTGVAGAWSTAFDVGPGVAARLVFATPSAGSVVGVPLRGIAVRVVDAQGNTVSSARDSVSVGVATGTDLVTGALSGTTTVRAAAGIAFFDSVVTEQSGVRALTAKARGLDSAVSPVFGVAPDAATHLTFLDQPTGVWAWRVISPIHVGVQDRFGNLTDIAAAVTVGIAAGTGAGGAALAGTVARQPADGVARFDDLSIDRPGTAYRLAAAAPGLAGATSDSFEVGPERLRLAFLVQPSVVPPGMVMAPAIQVAFKDHRDSIAAAVTGAVTLQLASLGPDLGAVLGGTLTRPGVEGIASFDDLTVNKDGEFILTASASTADSAVSDFFDVPAKVLFYMPPSAVATNAVIRPAVVVGVADRLGNPIERATNPITLSIGSGPPGAKLGGTVTRVASLGAAIFDDLTLDLPGTYTLTATTAGLPVLTSSDFEVSAP